MKYRKRAAYAKRMEANILAADRPYQKHLSNGDETKFRHDELTDAKHNTSNLTNQPSYLLSFTKGMPHNITTGLLEDPKNYPKFVKAIDSGEPLDFRDVPLGHENHVLGYPCTYAEIECNNEIPSILIEQDNIQEVDYLFTWKSKKIKELFKSGHNIKLRAWESQGAGNVFELQGYDPQAVTMSPAPKLGSNELTAEIAEIYCQAILRDVPFSAFGKGVFIFKSIAEKKELAYEEILDILQTNIIDVNYVNDILEKLNRLGWFNKTAVASNASNKNAYLRKSNQTSETAFRGITPGDYVGPYLSQFLLAGNAGFGKSKRSPSEGLISFGANTINQRVQKALVGKDYMTDWYEWLDIQNGADLVGFEEYDKNQKIRFIYTARDLATYVHYDVLYQAYLNACLILLSLKVPFDTGIPFQQCDNIDHQRGFAHFGAPHILSLIAEVATRALKAVRFQKFNVHRRCRPESLAARIHKHKLLEKNAPELKYTVDTLKKSGILKELEKKNGKNNYLLPMAYCEGSPMHPSYGAGHATVAGACVTILKAFFDHKHPLEIVPINEVTSKVKNLILQLDQNASIKSENLAYVAANNGKSLEVVPVLNENGQLGKLTVEGELNKLASNISIGRNWAGVHYFSDYYESILLGEQIAIGILEEQKLMFNENFSMSISKFNGETIRI